MIGFQCNDTQTTLVTSPPCSSTSIPLASTVLDFDRDDVFNASVYFRCGCPSAANPLYTVKTCGPLTVIRRHSIPIAAIERKSLTPDCITLWPFTPSIPGMYVDVNVSGTEGDVSSSHDMTNEEADILGTLEECGIVTSPQRAGGRTMELSEWLRSPEASTYPVQCEVADKVYEWREGSAGELVLYDSVSHPSMPVSWFHPSSKGDTRSSLCTYLAIHTTSNDVRDAVFVSFIALEQRRRVIRGDRIC